MAQDLSEKELLRMEVEQLKKEVKNPRDPVSMQSLFLASISLSVRKLRRHQAQDASLGWAGL